MQSEATTPVVEPETDVHAEALRRLEKKRDFRGHLLAYVLVNAGLWAIWGVVFAVTGAWFPWPLFVLFGWGIGLAFHAWDAYGRLPFTEEQVRREEARLQQRRTQ
jgi:fatty acid desaturase